MRLFIKVKPNAKENKIEKISEDSFIVKIKEPPKEGRANKALIELLAEYFKVPKSKIKIISGQFFRQKILEITD